MLCRLAATVIAGALVLVPPVRAGLDGSHHDHDNHGVYAPPPSPDHAGTGAAADEAATGTAAQPGPVSPDAVAFGYGFRTGFYPSTSPRELVLSFDDGPDLKFTPLVLDELDRRGLKAIFFVTGRRVIGDRPEDLARRELLGRIAAHGHMVANHTMTHRDLCQVADDAEAAAEIDQNAEVIAEATGVRPLLFRAPYGARCHKLEAALGARSLVSVGWNIDPQDWRNPTSEGILSYLQVRLGRLQGRGILLLHDTHPASVFALGPLLDWIARENRAAVRAGRPPIMMRDYSVFLPERPLPHTGMGTVTASVLEDVRTGLLRGFDAPAIVARR
jgi:peptidoglycan/xylan/chitin deacetylase (PgdA/CDA1 family)